MRQRKDRREQRMIGMDNKKIRTGMCRAGMVLILGMFMSGCGDLLAVPVGAGALSAEEAAAAEDVSRYEITDADRRTENMGYREINLAEPEESPDESYTWEEGCLYIRKPGGYVLSGSLDGGSLVVNVYRDENVHLILNNAQIHGDGRAAVYVEKAGKVILTAAEGTENLFTDSPQHKTDQSACLFGSCSLTINGSGKLTVYGYHEDGIRTRDLLKVLGTTLEVRARKDGLRGNDGVILLDSEVSVESEGTGIFSDSEKDMIMIQGGSCSIIAGENGISARRHVSVHGCSVNLRAVLEPVHCDGVRDLDGGTG